MIFHIPNVFAFHGFTIAKLVSVALQTLIQDSEKTIEAR